jgi:hypothetical protein
MLKLQSSIGGSKRNRRRIMKICAYCTAKNRDEAIFCTRCKRALVATPARKEYSSRNVLNWLLAGLVLVGLSYYLFSSRSLLGLNAMEPPTATSNWTPTSGPMPTRIQEPITINTCVSDTTRIRRSPSTQSETIGGLVSGTCLTILGRNEDASWVYMVSEDHQTGWVSASILRGAGNLNRVSVRDHHALASSARPTLTSAEIAHGAQAYLTQVAATNIPQSSLSRNVVPCFETADRIGEHISCKLERAYCDYLASAEGSPTFCTDRPYPDHTFTLMVSGEDWSDYDGQCLLISGYLQVDRGALQIEALNHSQVSTCD